MRGWAEVFLGDGGDVPPHGASVYLSLSREHTPRELWTSPAFRRGCAVTTAIWAGVFLINTLLNGAKLSWPAGGGVMEVPGCIVLVTGIFATDASV